MKLRVSTLMAGGGVLFGGCVLPLKTLDHPGISGRVVDAKSKRGIEAAQISMTPEERWATGRHPATGTSTADGAFLIKPKVNWDLVFFWGAVDRDVHDAPYHVTVRKPGYDPATTQIRCPRASGVAVKPFHPATVDLGVISLRKVPGRE